jgi:hypothetical protein
MNSIGILGVGFSDPKSLGQSWIAEAYQRSLIPAPVFSLALGRYDPDPAHITDGSLMIIGGYDQDLVDGSITWINCSGSIHFQIPLDGIIVNGHTIKREGNLPMQAIIDVVSHNRLTNSVWNRWDHYRSYQCRSGFLQSNGWGGSPGTTWILGI